MALHDCSSHGELAAWRVFLRLDDTGSARFAIIFALSTSPASAAHLSILMSGAELLLVQLDYLKLL